MQKVIFTIAIGKEFSKLSSLSHPYIKNYADKVGADFVVCNSIGDSIFPHFRKFQIYDLLKTYDRLLFIDTDILVKPNSPNIFEIVPEDQMGMFDESNMPFLQSDGRLKRWTDTYLEKLNEFLVDSGKPKYNIPERWGKVYYNSGVIVCSKIHRDLFKYPPFEFKSFGIHDQNYINFITAINNIQMFNLSRSFNFRFRKTDPDLENAYFIHFNGIGHRIRKMKNLIETLN